MIKQSPTVSPMALDAASTQHAMQVVSGGPQVPFNPASLPPDQPSVPINDYDYHQWHAMKCQDWLNGNDCRKQLAKGNQAGVQNVVLHWKAHVAAMAAMMPPPMAEPTGPPKKPPAKAEATPANTVPPALGPPPITM